MDATAALDWVFERFANSSQLHVYIWGQSIGASVATAAAAKCYQQNKYEGSKKTIIDGLILETPFVSMRKLLATLYPKWLPYRYLWPFLTNPWNSQSALTNISHHKRRAKPAILILQAGKDELISADHALELKQICFNCGLATKLHIVPGTLHAGVLSSRIGQRFVASFVRDNAVPRR